MISRKATSLVRLPAYAKLNLSLEVLGKRPDGYHEVLTVLQTLSLADQVTLEPASSLSLICNVHGLEGESNLAFRAAQALQAATGYTGGARIALEKRIPIAAGLGGGSTDAAVVLRGLNTLWKLGLTTEALTPIAASLGADVPFFLTGGTGLGSGRGDSITPLRPLPPTAFVLLHPPIHLERKTARLYGLLEPSHHSDGSHTRQVVEFIGKGVFQERMAYNIFDTVADMAYPDLAPYMRAFVNAGGWYAHLAGSGPTLFAVMHSPEEGEAVAAKLREQGHEAYAVTSVGPATFP